MKDLSLSIGDKIDTKANSKENWIADKRQVIKSFNTYLYIFGNLLSQSRSLGSYSKLKKNINGNKELNLLIIASKY